MTHLKKRVTFAGVDYILVPERLWDGAKDVVERSHDDYKRYGDFGTLHDVELFDEIIAYDGVNELKEPDNV